MPKFRKKPIEIEAFRFGIDEHPGWFTADPDVSVTDRLESGVAVKGSIRTLEGTMQALHGDWIIKGVKGELYPCRPDIFEATYEPA